MGGDLPLCSTQNYALAMKIKSGGRSQRGSIYNETEHGSGRTAHPRQCSQSLQRGLTGALPSSRRSGPVRCTARVSGNLIRHTNSQRRFSNPATPCIYRVTSLYGIWHSRADLNLFYLHLSGSTGFTVTERLTGRVGQPPPFHCSQREYGAESVILLPGLLLWYWPMWFFLPAHPRDDFCLGYWKWAIN